MSTLTEIADQVSVRAAELSRLLKEAKHPDPTFEESGVNDYDPKHYGIANGEAIRAAKNALVNAANDLSHLAMGPMDYLCQLSWSATKIASLGSIVRLEVPRRIPLGGSKPLSELIAEIGLPELIASRVIRYAVTNGILAEEPVSVIRHTATSAKLATDRDAHNFCLFWSTEISSLLVKFPEALVRKQALGDKGPHSAANIAFPEYVDLFDYFAKRSDAAQRYSTYLASRGRTPSWSATFLLDAYDWSSLGSGTVVDIGSSAGLTSELLANNFPKLNIVNQDISPTALKEGEARINELGLQTRVKFAYYDFFKVQTLRADAYILKSILHDWSDEDSTTIIKNLVPALENGSHVLIGECLMPDPPALRSTAWDFETKRVEDQIMIAGHGALERTLEQFENIFKAASPHFRLASVKNDVAGSVFSLIDFEYITNP